MKQKKNIGKNASTQKFSNYIINQITTMDSYADVM